jgi:class 3 adenylate cyclase
VTFATRIALAMAGTVLVAMAIVAVAGGSRVRRSYIDALRGSLEARIDAVAQSQSDIRAQAKAEVERLVRSPRLVATMLAGDSDALRKTAADELRDVLDRAGPGSDFAFAGEDGAMLASDGLPAAVSAIVHSEARSLLASEDGSRLRFVAVDGAPFEVLAAVVVDRADDARVGCLSLCSPVRLPEPFALADGTQLQAGISIAGGLFGTSLGDAPRRAVEGELAAGATQVDLREGPEPAIALQRPIPGASGASLVVVAGLGPMRAAERGLVLSGAVATAVALGVGVAFAFVLARGLSRPVAALGAAARGIESGDFTVRVRGDGRDELAQLGRRFNAMAEGLEQRERYRRVLDAVADPEVAAELMAGKLDLGGAEQDVGILFCDIRGFTALTEGKPPQAVIALLNEHMTLLTDVAYAHGGTVDKFVGDLIMVTFGAPKPARDDALRMARCARAMLAARADANARGGVPVQIGIGCAYGKVVAGCMGSARRLDYTVLGERVNLAARLCSKAPAMHAYVDSATRDAVADRGTFGPLPPIEAKGFSRPVEAFDLLATEDRA